MIPTKVWKKKRQMEILSKIRFLLMLLIILTIGIVPIGMRIVEEVEASNSPSNWIDDGELHKVSATAYVDTQTSTGRKPVEGLTVAGPREWIDCTCAMYSEDFEFLGYYEFMDVGYGSDCGYGESKLKKGKGIGSIEAGKTIDLYFDSKSAMDAWGKRTVYIQVIDAKG